MTGIERYYGSRRQRAEEAQRVSGEPVGGRGEGRGDGRTVYGWLPLTRQLPRIQ